MGAEGGGFKFKGIDVKRMFGGAKKEEKPDPDKESEAKIKSIDEINAQRAA